MTVSTQESLAIAAEEDIVNVRALAKRFAVKVGLSLVNQTKLVTAASELARNTLDYGLGGTALFEIIESGGRQGVRIRFEDHGPGIADIRLALQDGFTSGKGMGLGLSGSKRLMDEFDIATKVGEGTIITIAKWK